MAPNKIKSDVPQDHIGDNSKVISVVHLQTRDYRNNDLEDTVLALKVLNCTVGAGTNTHSSKAATNSSQAFKKQRENFLRG
jgi:hypothetical protein